MHYYESIRYPIICFSKWCYPPKQTRMQPLFSLWTQTKDKLSSNFGNFQLVILKIKTLAKIAAFCIQLKASLHYTKFSKGMELPICSPEYRTNSPALIGFRDLITKRYIWRVSTPKVAIHSNTFSEFNLTVLKLHLLKLNFLDILALNLQSHSQLGAYLNGTEISYLYWVGVSCNTKNLTLPRAHFLFCYIILYA